jgi:hypothetical protein
MLELDGKLCEIMNGISWRDDARIGGCYDKRWIKDGLSLGQIRFIGGWRKEKIHRRKVKIKPTER